MVPDTRLANVRGKEPREATMQIPFWSRILLHDWVLLELVKRYCVVFSLLESNTFNRKSTTGRIVVGVEPEM